MSALRFVWMWIFGVIFWGASVGLAAWLITR